MFWTKTLSILFSKESLKRKSSEYIPIFKYREMDSTAGAAEIINSATFREPWGNGN